jgi:hypothetical protein
VQQQGWRALQRRWWGWLARGVLLAVVVVVGQQALGCR